MESNGHHSEKKENEPPLWGKIAGVMLVLAFVGIVALPVLIWIAKFMWRVALA